MAVALIAVAPITRAAIGTDASGVSPPPPSPSPIPTNAFLSLDVTAGDPNTQITVNGGAFLPNESMTLIWDPPDNKVAGGAVADSSGNFTTHVKPFTGDAPGLHHLCASVPPNPCATFTLQAVAVTPTPQASPSPDTSPSPSPSPTDTASPTPVAATLNGIDLMLKPPFVILPIIAGAGLAIALVYWILSIVMRPRQKSLKSVAVAHLASRPDYAAGFGTPPPVPAPPAPPPSAWADVLPEAPASSPGSPEPPAEPQALASEEAPEAAPAEPSAAAAGEPSATPPGVPPEALPPDPAAAPDEPPDFPEPVDY
ncbi:MAG: hypothetical protein ACREOY_07680 [Candidatus Dormibacteraceae bacterium]